MRFVSPTASLAPLTFSHVCLCIGVLSASAQDAPEATRAPMAVVIIALDDDAKIHTDALEAECKKSDKIELVDPTLLQSAMIAFTLSPLEEEPSRRSLLAQLMSEQGVETIITIATGDTAKEYNIIAIGPSGEQKRQTSIWIDETSPEYNKQIENGLTSAFATVAPEVLAERKVRPKPSIPDTSTPITPPPTEANKPEPKAISSAPSSIEDSPTISSPAPSAKQPAKSERPNGTKKKVIFASVGPAINIIGAELNPERSSNEREANIELTPPGATRSTLAYRS